MVCSFPSLAVRLCGTEESWEGRPAWELFPLSSNSAFESLPKCRARAQAMELCSQSSNAGVRSPGLSTPFQLIFLYARA